MRQSFINKTSLTLSMAAAAILLMAAVALGADAVGDKSPVPGKSDKCPVCGMVVYRYPDFVASVTFNDGRTVFFDGAKDMFKYLFNIEKYARDHKATDVRGIYATEYYDMRSLDGRKAFYVIGSDVYGPMGHELIPLKSLADARQFKKDHHGRRIVTFEQITPALVRQLD